LYIVTDEVLQKLGVELIIRSHDPRKAADGKPHYDHSGKVVTINSSRVYGEPFMVLVDPERAKIEKVISLKETQTESGVVGQSENVASRLALLPSAETSTRSGTVRTSEKTSVGTSAGESEDSQKLREENELRKENERLRREKIQLLKDLRRLAATVEGLREMNKELQEKNRQLQEENRALLQKIIERQGRAQSTGTPQTSKEKQPVW
jgi:chromosome segregation ATPase